jgi:hypothetical protein
MANGWCKTREGHDGRFDHEERETCVGFEAESVVMERLTAEAREHDRRNEGRIEARYVAQYRPY